LRLFDYYTSIASSLKRERQRVKDEGITHHCRTPGDVQLSVVRNKDGSIPIQLSVVWEFCSHDPDMVVEDLHVGRHVHRSLVWEWQFGDHVKRLGITGIDHGAGDDLGHEVQPFRQPVTP